VLLLFRNGIRNNPSAKLFIDSHSPKTTAQSCSSLPFL